MGNITLAMAGKMRAFMVGRCRVSAKLGVASPMGVTHAVMRPALDDVPGAVSD